MLHWLHSLLPHVPRYGYVLVFIVVFLNNVGLPLPGEAILLGAGFILGRTMGSLLQPALAGTLASFLGGICAFWLGRRLGQGGLQRIHWLHLTPKRLEWPQRYFERHGAKAVFLARLIAIFPPIAANLLAGMTSMSWRSFLVYNLAGSAVLSVGYILIGYLLGKNWGLLAGWLSPMAFYLILAALTLIAPGIIFRHALYGLLARLSSKKRVSDVKQQ
jgi:membrane protein DedA with SNARE-associated domain